MTDKLKTKNKIFIVGGPTATGKTDLGIELVKLIDAEIINADSVQVYKYLDIGSNKGNLVHKYDEIIFDRDIPIVDIEASGTYGHLFDFVMPGEDFSVSHYQQFANEVIKDLFEKNKVPVLVGGTGLYIDAVIKQYDMDRELQNKQLRQRLVQLSLEQLQDELRELDENALNTLNNSDKNNPRRLIRLIEKTIIPIEKIMNQKFVPKLNFETVFLYPEFNREDLYKKIENRVDRMFAAGFVEEVKGLLKQGYNLSFKSMNSSGYREVVNYINGEIKALDECIKKVKTVHKNYVKRQITWFEGKGRGYDLIVVNEKNFKELVETNLR